MDKTDNPYLQVPRIDELPHYLVPNARRYLDIEIRSRGCQKQYFACIGQSRTTAQGVRMKQARPTLPAVVDLHALSIQDD